MIPQSELPSIVKAITDLVKRFGHPDEIPLGEMQKLGVSKETEELCMMLVTEEVYPPEPERAVAKWLRAIGEIVK